MYQSSLKFISSILFCCFAHLLISQPSGSIPFDKSFQFKPGLYLEFKDWKNNDPVPFENILTDLDRNSPDFFKKLFSKHYIYFKDAVGKEWKVKPSQIFGLSIHNQVFDKNFAQIKFIGSICYYADTRVDVINELIEVGLELSTSYFPNTSSPNRQWSKPDLKEFIIDFATGETTPFNQRNVEVILKRDREIYREYQKAKGAKKDKLYRFMYEYNKKYPVYFRE